MIWCSLVCEDYGLTWCDAEQFGRQISMFWKNLLPLSSRQNCTPHAKVTSRYMGVGTWHSFMSPVPNFDQNRVQLHKITYNLFWIRALSEIGVNEYKTNFYIPNLVKLYLHSPTHPHYAVLNKLCERTTLPINKNWFLYTPTTIIKQRNNLTLTYALTKTTKFTVLLL